MPLERRWHPVPRHQPDADLAQANPVQNQWYTVLPETRNCRLIACMIGVATTAETLEIEWVVDGVTYVEENSCTANTFYEVVINHAGGFLFVSVIADMDKKAFQIEGRSIRVRVRKTTAAGTGTLFATILYSKY